MIGLDELKIKSVGEQIYLENSLYNYCLSSVSGRSAATYP